jgi:hypothetical protein
VFLVCAVASVLGNRVFLIITGYPQLGNGTLHISHAIWGALMMAVAIIFAVSFLPPNTRGFIAFLGGAGFGWFIDELGKFITRDVNYFFRPTIALIYIVFITMYLVFRVIERKAFGPDEAVLNGLEALKAASIGQLDDPERRAALAMIDDTGATGPLAEQVRRLLADVSALPDPSPGRWARAGQRIRAWYQRIVVRRGFVRAIESWFVLIASLTIVGVVWLALDGTGIVGVVEWASVISSIVTGVFLVIGIVFLRRDRLRAYRWFERGVLVNIFVTQVFEFAQEQLAGVFGLVFNIGIWLAIRGMIRAEVERAFEAEQLIARDVERSVGVRAHSEAGA